MAGTTQSPRWRFSGDFAPDEQHSLLKLARKVSEQRGHSGSARLLRFERIKGNKSEAAVYDVSFVDSEDITLDRFAVKVYPDARSAREESDRAQSVQGKDYFAKLGVSYFEDFPHAVVYAYVGANEQAMSLARVIGDGLDKDVVRGAFEHFFRGIHRELSTSQSSSNGSEYVNALRTRLPPDFILETEKAELEGDRLIVLPADEGRHPRFPKAFDIAKLPEVPRWGDHLAFVEWSAMKGACPDYANGLKPNLPLRLGDKLLWLRVEREAYEELLGQLEGPDKTAAKDGILLTFPSNLIRSVDQDLRALSYPPSAIIDYEELRKCALNVRPLLRYLRHTDLHLDNIVYAAQKMTAVDLASIGVDSAFVCHARLETSIWYRVLDALSLSAEDAAALLKTLEGGNEFRRSGSAKERLAVDVLFKIRAHASSLLSEVGANGPEQLILTYATQALIHQRQALRDQKVCSAAWAAFVAHWFDKVRSLDTLGAVRPTRTVAAPVLREGPASVPPDIDGALESIRQEMRTLRDLVESLAGRLAAIQDGPLRRRGSDDAPSAGLALEVEKLREEMHSLEERVGAATLAAPAEAIPTTDDSFSNELRSLRATPGWPFVKWAVLLGVALLCGVGSLVMGSHWAR